MAYIYRYIDLQKEEVCYIGKVTKDADVLEAETPLERRDRQHRREKWYMDIGEENLLLQYIEMSHTDADMLETWLINWYGEKGQLVNKAKMGWGKSAIDLYPVISGRWRNFGQNAGDIYNDAHAQLNVFLAGTENLRYHVDTALETLCEELKRMSERLLKAERISRFTAQDDFERKEK